MTSRARSVLGSRRAKAILLLFLLGVTATASATVYTYFYANTTGTVRSPDVTLVAGGDSSSCASAYPCASVSISGTSDTATVSLSLFPADNSYSPPPSTYYTDLVEIHDANNAHTVESISITNVGSTGTPYGSVTVYYCTTQCTFDSNGAVSGGLVGSYSFTSNTGGTISGLPQSIIASTSQNIEVVAYAGSGAGDGNTITFKVAVQWV